MASLDSPCAQTLSFRTDTHQDYLASSTIPHSSYLNLADLTGQYLGLPSHYSGSQEDIFHLSLLGSDTTGSSPEPGDESSSGSSTPAHIFSFDPSLGYLDNEVN